MVDISIRGTTAAQRIEVCEYLLGLGLDAGFVGGLAEQIAQSRVHGLSEVYASVTHFTPV